jgi:tetratricopeptide (TPR) repeat protein
MRLLPVVLLLTLAACGGKPPPEVPTDPTLRREQDAGRAAMSLERPEQAIENYKAALVRAELRDDPEAIADMGFNVAVAQLRAGLVKDALATARSVRAELARRGLAANPALDLAEATALYRTGDTHAATRLADTIRTSTDRAAAARANFLLGLIADGNGDLSGLRAARARLPPAGTDEPGTDAAELDARIAFRTGAWAAARAGAEQVTRARRDLLDYRGLARALALEAAAAEQSGDREGAADLYLRAGRSAASQNDIAAARDWLGRAIAVGRDAEVLSQARTLQRGLAAK